MNVAAEAPAFESDESTGERVLRLERPLALGRATLIALHASAADAPSLTAPRLERLAWEFDLSELAPLLLRSASWPLTQTTLSTDKLSGDDDHIVLAGLQDAGCPFYARFCAWLEGTDLALATDSALHLGSVATTSYDTVQQCMQRIGEVLGLLLGDDEKGRVAPIGMGFTRVPLRPLLQATFARLGWRMPGLDGMSLRFGNLSPQGLTLVLYRAPAQPGDGQAPPWFPLAGDAAWFVGDLPRALTAYRTTTEPQAKLRAADRLLSIASADAAKKPGADTDAALVEALDWALRAGLRAPAVLLARFGTGSAAGEDFASIPMSESLRAFASYVDHRQQHQAQTSASGKLPASWPTSWREFLSPLEQAPSQSLAKDRSRALRLMLRAEKVMATEPHRAADLLQQACAMARRISVDPLEDQDWATEQRLAFVARLAHMRGKLLETIAPHEATEAYREAFTASLGVDDEAAFASGMAFLAAGAPYEERLQVLDRMVAAIHQPARRVALLLLRCRLHLQAVPPELTSAYADAEGARLLRHDPATTREAIGLLLQITQRSGDDERQLEALTLAAEAAASPREAAAYLLRRVAHLQRKGEVAAALREGDAALELLHQADTNSHHPVVTTALAEALEQLHELAWRARDWRRIQSTAEALLPLTHKQVRHELVHHLALAYEQFGEPHRAITLLEQALERWSEEAAIFPIAELYAQLAALLAAEGDLPAALRCIEHARAHRHSASDAHTHAELLLRSGQLEAAATVWRDCLAHDPIDVPALDALERVARSTGDRGLMLQVLEQKLQALDEPAAQTAILERLAELNLALDEREAAETYAQRALLFAPTSQRAVAVAARVRALRGDFVEAWNVLDLVTELALRRATRPEDVLGPALETFHFLTHEASDAHRAEIFEALGKRVANPFRERVLQWAHSDETKRTEGTEASPLAQYQRYFAVAQERRGDAARAAFLAAAELAYGRLAPTLAVAAWTEALANAPDVALFHTTATMLRDDGHHELLGYFAGQIASVTQEPQLLAAAFLCLADFHRQVRQDQATETTYVALAVATLPPDHPARAEAWARLATLDVHRAQELASATLSLHEQLAASERALASQDFTAAMKALEAAAQLARDHSTAADIDRTHELWLTMAARYTDLATIERVGQAWTTSCDTPERLARAWRTVADARRERDDLWGAADALAQVIAQGPTGPEVFADWRELLLKTERWQAAADALAQEIERTTGTAERASLFLELALLREQRLDDVAGAIAAYEAAFTLEPSLPAGRVALASLYERQGNRTQAAEWFRRAAESAPPSQQAMYLARGHALLAHAAEPRQVPVPVVTEKELTRPSLTTPTLENTKVWLRIKAAMESQAWAEAEAALEAQEPASCPAGIATYWQLLADVRERRGDKAGALAAVMKALAEAPGHRGSRVWAVRLAEELKSHEISAFVLARWLDDPATPAEEALSLREKLATALLRLGQYVQAKSVVLELLREQPFAPSVLALRAEIAGAQRDAEGLRLSLGTLAGLAPTPRERAALLHRLGHELERMGVTADEAEEWYERARDVAPYAPTLWRLVDAYWPRSDSAGLVELAQELAHEGALRPVQASPAATERSLRLYAACMWEQRAELVARWQLDNKNIFAASAWPTLRALVERRWPSFAALQDEIDAMSVSSGTIS